MIDILEINLRFDMDTKRNFFTTLGIDSYCIDPNDIHNNYIYGDAWWIEIRIDIIWTAERQFGIGPMVQ